MNVKIYSLTKEVVLYTMRYSKTHCHIRAKLLTETHCTKMFTVDKQKYDLLLFDNNYYSRDLVIYIYYIFIRIYYVPRVMLIISCLLKGRNFYLTKSHG